MGVADSCDSRRGLKDGRMTSERWITITQALEHVTAAVGGKDIAEERIKSKLILGRIKAVAAHYADSASQATWRLNVALPPGRFPFFWRAATIDWSNSTVTMDGDYRDFTGSLQEEFDFPPRAEGVQLSAVDVLREWPALNPPALLPEPPSQATNRVPGRRGPEPQVLQRVLAEMASYDALELRELKEVAMEKLFGASRDTCRRARDIVLSKIVGVSNPDK